MSDDEKQPAEQIEEKSNLSSTAPDVPVEKTEKIERTERPVESEDD